MCQVLKVGNVGNSVAGYLNVTERRMVRWPLMLQDVSEVARIWSQRVCKEKEGRSMKMGYLILDTRQSNDSNGSHNLIDNHPIQAWNGWEQWNNQICQLRKMASVLVILSDGTRFSCWTTNCEISMNTRFVTQNMTWCMWRRAWSEAWIKAIDHLGSWSGGWIRNLIVWTAMTARNAIPWLIHMVKDANETRCLRISE
jgi:hypothetical protein